MSDALDITAILQRLAVIESDNRVRRELRQDLYSITSVNSEWLCQQLRTALADTRRVDPDYCYDPANWEVTLAWNDRDLVHNEGDSLLPMLQIGRAHV